MISPDRTWRIWDRTGFVLKPVQVKKSQKLLEYWGEKPGQQMAARKMAAGRASLLVRAECVRQRNEVSIKLGKKVGRIAWFGEKLDPKNF